MDVMVADVQDWRYQQNKRQKTGGAEAWGQANVIPDRRKTVFIRNLPFKATQQDVASFFAACGAITDIRRGLDSQGGSSDLCAEFAVIADQSLKCWPMYLHGRRHKPGIYAAVCTPW